MRIGIIDNGVDSDYLQSGVKCYTVGKKNCVTEDSLKPAFLHGTFCLHIINHFLIESDLYSFRILNDEGNGNVSNIGTVLSWCFENNIRILNLSLGSTYYADKIGFRNLINHYANKGMIIIAASSNDWFTTYPAALSNVISVACGDEFCVDENLQRQKGIDFIAPSNHEIKIEGASFRLGKSNSYAAPYVSAMVGNLIDKKGMMTIDEIRMSLAPEGTLFIYSPDWIEKAWISPEYRRIDAEFYFNVDKRNLQECMDDIDTLVLCTHSEMERYGDLDKHVVYLGSDAKRSTNNRHHFWNAEMRQEQIMLSIEKDGIIDVPIICFVFNRESEIIRVLCKMRKLFADDGYNAFTGCGRVDSPLYDLEYLPNNIGFKKKKEDFIYWQTKFQQSDLILIGSVSGDEGVFLETNPDMVIRFNHRNDCIGVEICIDGQMSIENEYISTEKDIVGEVYHNIISTFEKKEDE